MMAINVVNVRTHSGPAEYIGRQCYGQQRSPLANPYRIVNSDRTHCLEKYRQWLWIEIQDRGATYDELMRLVEMHRAGETVNLACWCAPQSCHGDVVKSAIEWMVQND